MRQMRLKTPETPGRFSLRLAVYPPPQVLQINGRLCHLVLAFPYVGGVANGRAPSLDGHYSASSLVRTHPPPSRLRPTSRSTSGERLRVSTKPGQSHPPSSLVQHGALAP